MSTFRAFIAIHLPDEVKRALAEIATELARRVESGAVRWVRPEQIHLTLRFLGDIPFEQVPAIGAAMDAAASTPAFAPHLSGTGCFPNQRRPRVIWVGLVDEEARLATLKATLDAGLAPLGYPPEEKPFRAHLTLGRVKDERGVAGVEWSADVPGLEVPVAAIHLIESQLRPDGPIYIVRHSSLLSAS